MWQVIDLGVIATDGQGQVLFANASATRYLGLTWKHLTGAEPLPADWSLQRDGGLDGSLFHELRSVVRNPGRTTVWCIRQRGIADRWIEVSARRCERTAGPQAVVSLRDVSDRHMAACPASSGPTKFEAIVEAAHEGILVLDRDLRITYVNRRGCELSGFARTELVGRLASDMYPKSQDGVSAVEGLHEMWDQVRSGQPSRGELWIPRKDGSRLWMMASAAPLYDERGEVGGSVAMLTDLTEQKAMQEALDHLALHDPLTDVPNRRLFQDRLSQGLVTAHREQVGLALLIVDIDGFKQVNDSFGHQAGDAVLREAAARLRALLRESDTVARMGGDEFALILRVGGELSDTVAAAQRIRDALRQPMNVDGHAIEIDVSIGSSTYPLDGEDPDTLARRADAAMRQAKRERSGYATYTPALEHAVPSDIIIARELRQALGKRELDIVYQPEVDLRTGELHRVEALLRWRHPRRGLLLPDDFLPAAERTRAMAQVTRWVLNSVLHQVNAWQLAGWNVKASLNLSAWDLRDRSLPDTVDRLLRRWQLVPSDLTVEVTENVLMLDPEQAKATMTRLAGLGITLSLDDFGTGYSSLSFVKDLPSHEIKIDKSFVRNLEHEQHKASIVRALIQMAHELGETTVAEGIETKAAAEALLALGCDVGQGYYLAEPMTPDAFELWRLEHPDMRSLRPGERV